MNDRPVRPRQTAAPRTREDRLKDALKANMAKRKAQARARAETPSEDDLGIRSLDGDGASR